jgi:hypothetical protein
MTKLFRTAAYLLSLVAFGLSWVLHEQHWSLGFPDGGMTAFERAQKALLPYCIWMSALAGIGYAWLVLFARQESLGRKLLWIVGITAVCAMAWVGVFAALSSQLGR